MLKGKVKRFCAFLTAALMLCSDIPVNLGVEVHAEEIVQAEEFSVSFENDYAKVGTALAVNVTGGADVSYQWYVDGEKVENGTGSTYTPSSSDLEKWIKVEVVKSGGSEVKSAELYCSKLPVVYIQTENNAEIVSKEDYINASMKIQGNESYDPEDTTLYDGKIEIRGRGNTTWGQPKKPYKIKLNKKTSVFNMGKNKHWVLLANYMDESLMRNTLSYNLSGEMGMEHMDTVWVDVVLNGKYIGNYQFCEQVRVDKERVNIYDWEGKAEDFAEIIAEKEGLDSKALGDYMNENMEWVSTGQVEYNGKTYVFSNYPEIELNNIDGGYLLELDEYYDEVSKFKTTSGQPIMFKNPEFVYTNLDMVNYVRAYVQAFEDAVNSEEHTAIYNEYELHYSELYDMDALVDYWLVSEIFYNEEIGKKSTYMYKKHDELMKMGPIWDMDWTSGGEGDTKATNQWATVHFSTNAQADSWYKHLIQDPYFLMRAQERYWEIRDNQIQNMLNSIDTNYQYLKESGAADTAIWHTADSSGWGKDVPQTFDEDVQVLKTWMASHISWMDSVMATEASLKESMSGYYKADNSIKLGAVNAKGEDLAADTAKNAPSAVVLESGKNLYLTVQGDTYTEGTAIVFVNGKKVDTFTASSSKVTRMIPAKYLTSAVGEKDIIEVKVRSSKGYYYGNSFTVKKVAAKDEIEYIDSLLFLSYCDNSTLNVWDDELGQFTDEEKAEMKTYIETNIVTNQMSDYQKAKAIFDWIVNNVRYANVTESISALPYRVFKEKVAVCGGYSNLYKAMLNLVDIPAVVTIGVTDEGAHAWNAIYADSKWFFVDTTWGKSENMEWFDLPDGEFERTHTVQKVESATVESDGLIIGYDGGVAVVGVADEAITEVTIPDTFRDFELRVVSYQLFNSDYGVQILNVNKNVVWIDTQQNSKTLKAINVSSENVNYASIDGVLYTKDMSRILIYPQGKTSETYTLPKEVGEFHFKDVLENDYLANIEVENGNKYYSSVNGLVYNLDKSELLYVPSAQKTIDILSDATIDELAFANVDKTKIVIYAEANSPAHKYAIDNQIEFLEKPNHTHIWEKEYTVDTEPTLKKVGSKSIHCSECDAIKPGSSVEIAKLVNPFLDVPKGIYYEQAVAWAAVNGIAAGRSETAFCPNEACTRAEVVSFIWRTAGFPEPKNMTSKFSDVTQAGYIRHYKAIMWATENNIVYGYSDGTFRPDRIVKRDEFVTFLYRFKGSPDLIEANNPFEDILDKNEEFQTAIVWAYMNEITAGKDATHFLPDEPCSRSNVVTFLYQAR